MDRRVVEVLVKKILMVAYHYPPDRISSGVQRSLKFSRYLPDHEWEPSVLTAHPRAYQRTGNEQLKEIPGGIVVKRAFAIDAARHLAIKGRHPLLFAIPDRWIFWWFGAIWSGLIMIKQQRPSLLWSTYPIATAHLIALTLHRLTGLPWIADFRDSMTDDDYPSHPTIRRTYLWLERQVIARADRVIFTAPGSARMYADRYPDVAPCKWAVIPNGYDEDNFLAAESGAKQTESAGPILLIHSGILYPSERDPTHFFAALSELKTESRISADTVQIVLRATAHDELFSSALEKMDIANIVRLEPPIPYEEALREMVSADGLLLFQASNCNHQIPAKLYEYMRARRPTLALTDPTGDTALTMLESGINTIVRLDNKDDIKDGLIKFIGQIQSNSAPLAEERKIREYSRRAGTAKLAKILDDVISAKSVSE